MTHPRSLLVLALTATSLAGALSTSPSASAADGRSPAQVRPLLTSDEELALDVQLEMAAAHRHLVIQQVAARLAAARAAAAQQAALAAEAQRVAQAVAQQAAVQAANDQRAAHAQQAAAQAQQASQAAAQAQQATQAAAQAAQAQQSTQAPQSTQAQPSPQSQQSAQPTAGQSTGDPKGYARQLLSSRGEADQFGCLDSLWGRESGWQVSASNASSGAYGIPQALPGSKIASVGPDWQSNAATQIQWGLGYIGGRYGSPCAAWSHSQANGWY